MSEEFFISLHQGFCCGDFDEYEDTWWWNYEDDRDYVEQDVLIPDFELPYNEERGYGYIHLPQEVLDEKIAARNALIAEAQLAIFELEAAAAKALSD